MELVTELQCQFDDVKESVDAEVQTVESDESIFRSYSGIDNVSDISRHVSVPPVKLMCDLGVQVDLDITVHKMSSQSEVTDTGSTTESYESSDSGCSVKRQKKKRSQGKQKSKSVSTGICCSVHDVVKNNLGMEVQTVPDDKSIGIGTSDDFGLLVVQDAVQLEQLSFQICDVACSDDAIDSSSSVGEQSDDQHVEVVVKKKKHRRKKRRCASTSDDDVQSSQSSVVRAVQLTEDYAIAGNGDNSGEGVKCSVFEAPDLLVWGSTKHEKVRRTKNELLGSNEEFLEFEKEALSVTEPVTRGEDASCTLKLARSSIVLVVCSPFKL